MRVQRRQIWPPRTRCLALAAASDQGDLVLSARARWKSNGRRSSASMHSALVVLLNVRRARSARSQRFAHCPPRFPLSSAEMCAFISWQGPPVPPSRQSRRASLRSSSSYGCLTLSQSPCISSLGSSGGGLIPCIRVISGVDAVIGSETTMKPPVLRPLGWRLLISPDGHVARVPS